jgi:hypothetical protein
VGDGVNGFHAAIGPLDDNGAKVVGVGKVKTLQKRKVVLVVLGKSALGGGKECCKSEKQQNHPWHTKQSIKNCGHTTPWRRTWYF